MIQVTPIEDGADIVVSGQDPGSYTITVSGTGEPETSTYSVETPPVPDSVPSRPIIVNLDQASGNRIAEEDLNVVKFSATNFNKLEYQTATLPNFTDLSEWKLLPFNHVDGDTYAFVAPSYNGYRIRVRYNDGTPSDVSLLHTVNGDQEGPFAVVPWASRIPAGLSIVGHTVTSSNDGTVVTLELSQALEADAIPYWRRARMQIAAPSESDPEQPGDFADIGNPNVDAEEHNVYAVLYPMQVQYFAPGILNPVLLIWVRFHYSDSLYIPQQEAFTNSYKVQQ